ncbi:MAG: glutamine synthetase, partial [Thermomicrobia bacterium]|nr:glutamine synthetase [Thermomicrobia bacterium]
AIYALLRTGLEGPTAPDVRRRAAILPDNIYDAIESLRGSSFAAEALGHDVRDKYAELKQAAADRCPRKLGTLIKPAEIQFHHEVTNQYLWNRF